ncbi:phasin family protein [Sphingomonas flavalba]|uniref:phasin family protein n=1 Tax=Sphingomonas flavalba TaxID=2559804 RepID=UPI0039E0A4B0
MTSNSTTNGKRATKGTGKAPAKPAVATARAADAVKAGAIVQDSVEPVAGTTTEKGSEIVTETITKLTSEATERTQALFGDFNTRSKEAFEKGTKLVEELQAFNKGNIEAVVESAKVAAKGAEAFGQQAADTARKNYEKATATLKGFSTVKSPTELFQLQSEYARESFDAFVADASKNTEALLKLAGDVFQPLSNRIAVAAEKIKTAA